jgi:hypothetical protein
MDGRMPERREKQRMTEYLLAGGRQVQIQRPVSKETTRPKIQGRVLGKVQCLSQPEVRKVSCQSSAQGRQKSKTERRPTQGSGEPEESSP